MIWQCFLKKMVIILIFCDENPPHFRSLGRNLYATCLVKNLQDNLGTNKRDNDGPPHHRASQKYIYQHIRGLIGTKMTNKNVIPLLAYP